MKTLVHYKHTPRALTILTLTAAIALVACIVVDLFDFAQISLYTAIAIAVAGILSEISRESVLIVQGEAGLE